MHMNNYGFVAKDRTAPRCNSVFKLNEANKIIFLYLNHKNLEPSMNLIQCLFSRSIYMTKH